MEARYPLTLLYDASCPVCSLEMDHLRARDSANRLVFVDISAPGFDAAAYGRSAGELDAELHGVWADGSGVVGLATLRAAYAAVGLGWVLHGTGLGPLRPVFDGAYRLFARYRQPLSRAAAPLIHAVRARRVHARMATCRSGACDRPGGPGARS